MKTSPLHDRHLALGATMTEFGGFSMPVSYAGLVVEHRAVREAVGVFDVSHLGKLWIEAPVAVLNQVVTNDLARLAVGQAQYNLICTADGGVVDDLICYRMAVESWLLMPNAANVAEVERLVAAAGPTQLRVGDEAVIAIQGPKSGTVLQDLGLVIPQEYMSFSADSWTEIPVLICRSGYTGELGFEIVAPVAVAGEIWDRAVAAATDLGGGPAGLGARDTLRTEMGYPLHGHELAADRLATECGVSWAIAWEKPQFLGREALTAAKTQGAEWTLIAVQAAGRWVPRPGMPVVWGDAEIGSVTSGTFSPTLGCGIALARVRRAGLPKIGEEVQIANRSYTRVRTPFVSTKVR